MRASFLLNDTHSHAQIRTGRQSGALYLHLSHLRLHPLSVPFLFLSPVSHGLCSTTPSFPLWSTSCSSCPENTHTHTRKHILPVTTAIALSLGLWSQEQQLRCPRTLQPTRTSRVRPLSSAACDCRCPMQPQRRCFGRCSRRTHL
jgi:hypothetical protein